jgi:hypothetical protein
MSKKIIYIIGAGRSGTTLLDIVLGNNADTFSAGELNRFPIRNGIPPLLDKDNPKFVFWDKFKREFLKRYSKYDFDGLKILINKFEYHLGILRIIFSSKNNKTMNNYHEYLKTFFDTLSDQVEQEYIVDSSKYPCRAYHLSQIYKENISFVYIKRNPVDVVQSFAKKDIEQPPKSWFLANLYLFAVNLLCMLILRIIRNDSKVVRLTLEELTNEPTKTLTRISKVLDIDLSNSISLTQNYSPLKTGFLFDGNRLRLKEEFVMEKINLSSFKKKTFKDYLTIAFNAVWWN